jgi:hypothetical protein
MQRPKVILAQFSVLAQGVKNSVHVDSADQYIELVGDVDEPGDSMVYGTDSAGNKGWQTASVSIPDGSITNAKLASMAQATIKGRAAGAGTGVPQDLTAAQVKTVLAYAATEVSNTPAGSISATTVQAAINELDTEKQPLDSDLTAIAALTPSNDDLLQRKTGAWTNRTPAQVKVDLVLVKGDVGLGNVDNTSDVNKPVSTAQAAADALRVAKTGDTMTGPLAMGSNKITGLSNGTNPGDAINYGQLVAAGFGYTAVQQGGGADQGTNKLYLGWQTGANGLKAQVDSTDLGIVFSEWNVINACLTFDAGTHGLNVTGVMDSNGVILKPKKLTSSWNMDTTNSIDVAHGLTESKIDQIDVMIVDNSGFRHPLYRGGYFTTDGTNVNLVRTVAGVFDSPTFNAATAIIIVQSHP